MQEEKEKRGASPPDRIAGVPVELVLPERIDERWDIDLAMSGCDGIAESNRILAAALGLCWPALREWMARERLVYKPGKVAEFGGHVIHFLLGLRRPERALPGWTKPSMVDISRAGRAAQDLVTRGLVTEEQVREAEDFSGAPAANASPSSSTSSATGAESQDGSDASPPPPPRS